MLFFFSFIVCLLAGRTAITQDIFEAPMIVPLLTDSNRMTAVRLQYSIPRQCTIEYANLILHSDNSNSQLFYGKWDVLDRITEEPVLFDALVNETVNGYAKHFLAYVSESSLLMELGPPETDPLVVGGDMYEFFVATNSRVATRFYSDVDSKQGMVMKFGVEGHCELPHYGSRLNQTVILVHPKRVEIILVSDPTFRIFDTVNYFSFAPNSEKFLVALLPFHTPLLVSIEDKVNSQIISMDGLSRIMSMMRPVNSLQFESFYSANRSDTFWGVSVSVTGVDTSITTTTDPNVLFSDTNPIFLGNTTDGRIATYQEFEWAATKSTVYLFYEIRYVHNEDSTVFGRPINIHCKYIIDDFDVNQQIDNYIDLSQDVIDSIPVDYQISKVLIENGTVAQIRIPDKAIFVAERQKKLRVLLYTSNSYILALKSPFRDGTYLMTSGLSLSFFRPTYQLSFGNFRYEFSIKSNFYQLTQALAESTISELVQSSQRFTVQYDSSSFTPISISTVNIFQDSNVRTYLSNVEDYTDSRTFTIIPPGVSDGSNDVWRIVIKITKATGEYDMQQYIANDSPIPPQSLNFDSSKDITQVSLINCDDGCFPI